jgi:pimeloyl-ACP methyl ester carboxylesterase
VSRRSLWLGVLSIAVVAVVAVTAISYFAAQALTRHRSSRPSVTPADSGLIYQTVPLVARDGTKLEGWWIIPRDGVRRPDLATVVLAHAADGERPGALTGKAGMLRHAAWLSRAGFIVLAFDFRSYGGSEGSHSTGGEEEQQDLDAALRLVRERSLGARIFILGEGMGARVGLASIAQDPSVTALVADSPTPSRLHALQASGPFWTQFSSGSLVRLLGRLEDRPSFETLLQLAGPRPMMIILGGEDPIADDWGRVGRAVGLRNTGVAWIAPGANRLEAFDIAESEYLRRVSEFLETHWRATTRRPPRIAID